MTRRYTIGRHPPRCIYCGETRPRVIVVGGKAHRRCIPAPMRTWLAKFDKSRAKR